MHPLDRVGYAATWSKGMMTTNRQNIDRNRALARVSLGVSNPGGERSLA